MKAIILSLILISALQSCSTRNLPHSINNTNWSKPLRLNKSHTPDLSATSYILDENEVLIRVNKTNSYPTDSNSPFYRINKRANKSGVLNAKPRSLNEIKKSDFYSKNRAD